MSGTLSALEIEDLVTVRDVAAVAQRLEMVRRIATEIDGYVVELGTDGRLLTLQLNELVKGVAGERELVVRDYLPPSTGRKSKTADDVLLELDAVSPTDLLDIGQVARALQLGRRAARRSGHAARVPAAGQGSRLPGLVSTA